MDLEIMKEPEKKGLLKRFKQKLSFNQIEEIPISQADESRFNYIRKKGGFQEFPSYIYSNNRFYTVIRVHTYNDDLEDFWLTNFAFIKNLVIELDIDTEDVVSIKKSINRNIELENLRQKRARSYSEAQDAYDNAQESRNLYNEIKTGKGLSKISLNFIVWADSKEKLQDKIQEVKETMKKFDIEGSIFINSVAEDMKVTKFKNATGTIAPTAVLRTFFPFNFQEIIDPTGTYIGYSRNGGQIVIDHTLKTKVGNRLSNDILITGKTGNGKSAFVKNVLKKEFIQGHHSIILDPENEYSDFVKYMGGTIIDINKESIINPLEYRTEVEDGKVKGFSEHLNSLMTFFSIIEPEFKSIDKGRLNALLKAFYSTYFKASQKKINLEEFDINTFDTSKLKRGEFPTFTYLKKMLIDKIEDIKSKEKLRDEEYKSYTLIEQVLEKVVDDYGQYFVGTSSIDTVDEIEMIAFNLKPIEDLEGNVRNAIIYNILNVYCNNKILKNKEYNIKNKEERERILRIVLDEAHVFLNSQNPKFVSWYLNSTKRFRKYSACSLISSQSILDFKPLNITNDVNEDLLKIFNEILYKYFFFQELPTQGVEYVNISGLLTEEDIKVITSQQRGDFLLKLPKRKIIGHHFIDIVEQTKLYHT